MQPIFKTEMLIYQSKANLGVKILFDKITHHLEPEIRKLLLTGIFLKREFHVPFCSTIRWPLSLDSMRLSGSEIELKFSDK